MAPLAAHREDPQDTQGQSTCVPKIWSDHAKQTHLDGLSELVCMLCSQLFKVSFPMLIGSHPAYTGEAGGNTCHALQLLIRLDYLPIHIVPLPLSDLEWSTVLITIVCQHLCLLAPSPCLTLCTSWIRAAWHRGWPRPQCPSPVISGCFGN